MVYTSIRYTCTEARAHMFVMKDTHPHQPKNTFFFSQGVYVKIHRPRGVTSPTQDIPTLSLRFIPPEKFRAVLFAREDNCTIVNTVSTAVRNAGPN